MSQPGACCVCAVLALAGPPVQAAEAPRAQVYGLVDLAVEYVDARPVDSVWGMAHRWGASRLGLRLSEALPEAGVVINSRIEHRFSADTGMQVDPTRFWNGQSWLEARGRYGALRLGRDYTPVEQALGWSDLGDQGFCVDNIPMGTATRADALLQYQSPNTGPARVMLAVQATGSGPVRSLRSGALVLGSEAAVVYVAAQRMTKDTGPQDDAAIGASVQSGAWGLGLTWASVESPALGTHLRMWNINGRYNAPATQWLLALRRDTQAGQAAINSYGVATSRALSPRSFIYLAAGHARSERLSQSRIALGIRQLF